MGRFEELVAEGDAVPLDGWDFSWFDGRATEERPPWGYARLLAERLTRATAVLDVQTGGGEVLRAALAAPRPGTVAATESWGPNLAVARANLPGATVVESPDEGPLPFRDASFDLVSSRHPTRILWPEIARVLRPGGRYLVQGIGAGSNYELTEFFYGPYEVPAGPSSERGRQRAEAAGLVVERAEDATLRVEFFDIGAVVHFLRKVLWTVPGFSVEEYRDRLAELHARIERDGRFTCHSRRTLIVARKP